jgi:hypothetical protein
MDNETLKYLDRRLTELRSDLKDDIGEIKTELKNLTSFKFKMIGIVTGISIAVSFLSKYIINIP